MGRLIASLALIFVLGCATAPASDAVNFPTPAPATGHQPPAVEEANPAFVEQLDAAPTVSGNNPQKAPSSAWEAPPPTIAPEPAAAATSPPPGLALGESPAGERDADASREAAIATSPEPTKANDLEVAETAAEAKAAPPAEIPSGPPAPRFTLPSVSGTEVSLDSYLGDRKSVV